MPRTPRISLLLAVKESGAEAIARAIGSARAQLYPHWELIIAADAPLAASFERLIAERGDARIRLIACEGTGEAAAWNAALSARLAPASTRPGPSATPS